MNAQDYQAAVKKVRAEKPKENYLLITLNYDKKIILPHKEGTALLAAFASAELLQDEHSDNPFITPMEKGAFSIRNLSHEEYESIKIAMLLNVRVSELAYLKNPTN